MRSVAETHPITAAEPSVIDWLQMHLIEFFVSASETNAQACQRLGISERKLQVWMRRMGYGPRKKPAAPVSLDEMLARIRIDVEDAMANG